MKVRFGLNVGHSLMSSDPVLRLSKTTDEWKEGVTLELPDLIGARLCELRVATQVDVCEPQPIPEVVPEVVPEVAAAQEPKRKTKAVASTVEATTSKSS